MNTKLTPLELLELARSVAKNPTAIKPAAPQPQPTQPAQPAPQQKPAAPTANSVSDLLNIALANASAQQLKLAKQGDSAAEKALAMLRAKETAQALDHIRHAQSGTPQEALLAGTRAFIWNEQQLQAIELADNKRSFCLIGAAGTGKTTTVREVVSRLLSAVPHVPGKMDPVALVAFTNKATRNIRRACNSITDNALAKRAAACCSTIHKLLAFQPAYYEYESAKGELLRTMRFEPAYRMQNKLAHLKLVVIDEASMVELGLYKQLIEALPDDCVIIYIGDLNQLKPFGLPSILGFKLGEIPVVELTEVHRQAFDSPILAFQHNYTLQGKAPGDVTLKSITEAAIGKLEFRPLTQHREDLAQCYVFANVLRKEMLAGNYDPTQDIVLMPNNVGFGCVQTNKWIAQWLGEARGAVVHEVISRDQRHYLAEGDYVMYAKEEYFIASIRRNKNYVGVAPKEPSEDLMRTGAYRAGSALAAHVDSVDMEAAAESFDALLNRSTDEDTKLAASHVIELVPSYGKSCLEDALTEHGTANDTIVLSGCGDVNDLSFGYCITIHKSQGSEWRRVYLAFTKHHTAGLRDREGLYTAMTRAKETLIVYYSPDSTLGARDNTIARAILRPSIKGNTWREKLQHYELRRDEYEKFMSEPTEYGVEGGWRCE